jgi:disulfide bond formation protein DsbB
MSGLVQFSTAPRGALAIAAAASAALLAGAHAFERFGGLPPCALCLDQREAHWAGLGVALAGLALGLVFKARRVTAAAAGALALVYLVSAGLAFYHTGVEHKFWPGPATCSGAGPAVADPASLEGVLNGTAPVVSCTEAAWRLFGVSMAGYNLLVSTALFALCALAAAYAFSDARDAARPRARAEREAAS